MIDATAPAVSGILAASSVAREVRNLGPSSTACASRTSSQDRAGKRLSEFIGRRPDGDGSQIGFGKGTKPVTIPKFRCMGWCNARRNRCSSRSRVFSAEPTPRLELGTCGLRNRCSTTELSWRKGPKDTQPRRVVKENRRGKDEPAPSQGRVPGSKYRDYRRRGHRSVRRDDRIHSSTAPSRQNQMESDWRRGLRAE